MTESNPNSRVEVFCDGVFAIAMTLLVIDIKIPSTTAINNTNDLWLALKHTAPSISAFILSFFVILITWVNHHACFKLVNRSSSAFTYSNGFLLLTVVFVPFPTSLMGEHILTAHAGPAVFLYDAILALQGIAWVLLCGSALKDKLTKNERAARQMRLNRRNGYFAFMFYSLLAVIALWFPVTVAVITMLTWIFWLIFGINIKEE